MDRVSSRWRKPKAKKSKRTTHLAAARAKKEQPKQTREASTQTGTDVQPQPQTSKGRSEKKISLFDVSQNVSEDEYFIISGLVLRSVSKEFTCKVCKQKSLEVRIVNQKGFAFSVMIVCGSCEELQLQLDSSPRIISKDSTRPPFEANRKLVEAFIRCGGGYNAMLKFGTIVGMKVMDQSSYRDHLAKLILENKALKEEILSLAREAVRKYYIEEDSSLERKDVIDVTVSCDGSWHKRGRTSNYGFVAVIEVNTGLVLDFETLSKYCHICVITAAEMDKDSPEFIEWYENHLELGECNTNFSGASGNMEREGAVIMWKRSEHDAKMRYTRFVSDGDAKSLFAIQEAKPYGPDVLIEKDECTNHVGKRLGTALRNTVSDFSKRKITLGGKKPRALTQSKIDKLQGYFQKGIIENSSDFGKMKSAVLAPIHYYASTDDKPMHQHCPRGTDSWCFY